MNADLPFIPETITVHLGRPNDNADNVTVPFLDYVMNVASSEIYPTWPENAIRANMYAQISFVLNRIYTQYYRSRGYDFDITNSTAFDQYFVNGREIFENIREIAGDIFNDYIVRQGNVEPLFTSYCNGTTVTCEGLSQWGTVDLANQGLTPYEILQRYYGEDINIVRNAPVGSPGARVPILPLRLGSVGNDVRTLQIRLNRISANFPAIPKILLLDGVFGEDTEAAVREFQRVFGLTEDGIVGKSTWYTVQNIYNSVKRLSELNSEGLTLDEVSKQYSLLRSGDRGIDVANFQYYLAYLSRFYNTIPQIAVDGVFGEQTLQAVLAAQQTFGLPTDGIVGRQTWNTVVRAYLGAVGNIPLQFSEGTVVPYPGTILRIGSENDAVRLLQEYLNRIAMSVPELPTVTPTGYFGTQTQAAVIAFQNLVGLPPNGYVEFATWNAITSLYQDIYISDQLAEGQYPGFVLGSEED